MESASNPATHTGPSKGGPTAAGAQGPWCRGCGRHPRVCWVLPCLLMELAIRRGKWAVKAWLESTGCTVRQAGGDLIVEEGGGSHGP